MNKLNTMSLLIILAISASAFARPPRFEPGPAPSPGEQREEQEKRAYEREERDNSSGGGSYDDDDYDSGSSDDSGSSSDYSSGDSCWFFCRREEKAPEIVDDVAGCDDESVNASCGIYSFWWAKPHKEIKHVLNQQVPVENAKYLKLMSVLSEGRQGKTGTIGFAKIKIYLTDGSSLDVLKLAKAQFAQRVSKGGKLYLQSENELMDIALPEMTAGLHIEAISIKADSWIDADTMAHVQVWLDSEPTQFLD
jgi:hypothetical protein